MKNNVEWLTKPVVFLKVEFPVDLNAGDRGTWCETIYYRLRRQFEANGIRVWLQLPQLVISGRDDWEPKIGRIWVEWDGLVAGDEIDRALHDLEEIVRGDGPRLVVPPELSGDVSESE